jgi:hypothetical protein
MKKIFLFLLVVVYGKLLTAQSVGIGITSPNASAQLDITSTTKGLLIPRMTSAQRLAITTPAAGLMVYETTTSSFWFYNGSVWNQIGTGGVSPWTVNGGNIYNSNTGNVGIGLSSNINEKFTVKGDALFVYPGSNSVSLSLMANTNNSSIINFIKPDSSIVGRISVSDLLDRMTLQTLTNTNQLVLDDNGYIGVGTSSPTNRLDVAGNIRSRDTITADDDLVAGDDIRAGGMIEATGTVRGGALNSTGVLTVSGNSLFGGTAVVNGELSTNTGMAINEAAGILQFRTGGNDKGFVQLSGDDLRIGTNSSNINGKFVVRTAGEDQFFVDNAGYVGIGVSGLGAYSRLHIGTGLDASLTSNGYMMLGNITGSNLILDNNEIMARGANGATGNLVLQNDGGTVRIGNVAVPSGYKFAINGKMLCEELRVKLAANWPDYVFKNDYKLLPLTELKKFIEQYNHLPNIPKASVIESEGMEVGDMQKKMMEKIEELTLYIIDLQKQIDSLKESKQKQ